jgi:hypothetical protein
VGAPPPQGERRHDDEGEGPRRGVALEVAACVVVRRVSLRDRTGKGERADESNPGRLGQATIRQAGKSWVHRAMVGRLAVSGVPSGEVAPLLPAR